MAERTSDAVHHMKDQASSITQAIIEQAANRAVSGADKARDVASQARGEAKKRVSHAQKAGEDVVPSVREIALNAASAALDLWQLARERAEESVESAEHLIGEHAADVVNQAEKRAKHAVDAVNHAEKRAKHAANVVGNRAGEISGQAKEVTRSAADSSVTAGKDTGATLFWTAAAAGIVFYALLDKHRRDQVLHVIDTLAVQTREIIRDFQGYDEEFI